jgi:hypothetical protein
MRRASSFPQPSPEQSNIGRFEFVAVAVNFPEKTLDIHFADRLFHLMKANSLKSATLFE